MTREISRSILKNVWLEIKSIQSITYIIIQSNMGLSKMLGNGLIPPYELFFVQCISKKIYLIFSLIDVYYRKDTSGVKNEYEVNVEA